MMMWCWVLCCVKVLLFDSIILGYFLSKFRNSPLFESDRAGTTESMIAETVSNGCVETATKSRRRAGSTMRSLAARKSAPTMWQSTLTNRNNQTKRCLPIFKMMLCFPHERMLLPSAVARPRSVHGSEESYGKTLKIDDRKRYLGCKAVVSWSCFESRRE